MRIKIFNFTLSLSLLLVCGAEDALYSEEDNVADDPGRCGGSIQLSRTMDLTYENVGDVNQDTICIWAIYCPPDTVLGFTLSDMNFGNPTLSCSSLTIQSDFNPGQKSSKSVSLQPHDKGTEVTIHQRISILVFTSRGGQKFRVKLRAISQAQTIHSMLLSLSTSNVSAHTFWPKIDYVRSIIYPPQPGTYEDSETRVLIFEILPQHKFKIRVDFIDTEPRHDILSVYKFSRVEKRFLMAQSFSGHHGDLVSSQPIEGNENEPFLLHFQSDTSNSGEGFKISYSYQPADQIGPGHVTPSKVTQKLQYGTSCGGHISVDTMTSLSYRNEGSEDIESCIWVITVSKGGMIGFTLMDQTYENCTGYGGRLSVQMKSPLESSTVSRAIGEPDRGVEISVGHGLILLVFQSKEKGSSFNINFRRMGSYAALKDLKYSAYFLNNINLNTNFNYPPYPATTYEEYSRCVIVINPMAKKIILLTVNKLDMESDIDHLEIFAFSKRRNKFNRLRRLTGRLGVVTSAVFQGQPNEPMILTFESDGSSNGEGFSFTFNYQNVPDETLTTRLTPETFDSCGGLISLPKPSGLAYRSPAGSENGKMCVWVIKSSLQGFAMTLTKVYGAEDTNFGSLSLHHGFGSPLMTFGDQVISSLDQGSEIPIEEAVTVIIYATSVPSQGFHLNLRDNSDFRPTQRESEVLNFQIETIRASQIGTPRSYSYPPGALYIDNEMRLFVFESIPKAKIKLRFTYIDTEEGPDSVTVYKFHKSSQTIMQIDELTGRLGTNVSNVCEGGENEPLFIFFRTDGSVTGAGFRLTYVYERAEDDESPALTTVRTRKIDNRLRPIRKPDLTPNEWAQSYVGKHNHGENHHTVLYLLISIMALVIGCGAIYTIFCAQTPLVKAERLGRLRSIFTSCPMRRNYQTNNFRPTPTTGRQSMRKLTEDEDI